MDSSAIVIAVLGVAGSGAAASIATAWFMRRKTAAEAIHVQAETVSVEVDTAQVAAETAGKVLKDVYEELGRVSANLKAVREELSRERVENETLRMELAARIEEVERLKARIAALESLLGDTVN